MATTTPVTQDTAASGADFTIEELPAYEVALIQGCGDMAKI